MVEINLLSKLPSSKRNVVLRSALKSENIINESCKFGEKYFDGPREYGYGGYYYDGRWKPVAKDIIEHFKLSPGDKVIDIGCAKGFLVKDLVDLGIDAYGLDISEYALTNCVPEISDRLIIGNALKLPFENNFFDLAISINTLHNLKKSDVIIAIKELQRVSTGKGFIQVDSYNSLEGKKKFEEWVLTAKYHDYPKEWLKLFNIAGYKGDWYWTILE